MTLTRDQILALEAGPEMDAAVAEAIGCLPGSAEWIERARTRWSPSTDIAAAWDVYRATHARLFSHRARFLRCLQEIVSNKEGPCIAWPDVFWFITPETICRAALLAKVADHE